MPPNKSQLLVTEKQLAKLLEVSHITVWRWTRDGFLSRRADGRYDLARSLRAIHRHRLQVKPDVLHILQS